MPAAPMIHCPANCSCRGSRADVITPGSPNYDEAVARALDLIVAHVRREEVEAAKQRHPSSALVGGWLELPNGDDA